MCGINKGGPETFYYANLILGAMGKSPAKWMRTLIFGKKSTKSKHPKPNYQKKWEEDKEVPVSLDQIDYTNQSLSVSQMSDGKKEDDHKSNHSQDEVRTLVPANQIVSILETTELNEQNDSDRIREEQAATYVQAALRGYLARRGFWSLKGIIRLQALIRGHLVRRQAISTLHCMFQIVKFQALARGRKIRHSVIGVEVQTRCTRVNRPVMCSVGVEKSMQTLKLSSNGFARKIAASSLSAIPLHFHYNSNESNSVLCWLERWSTSRCWHLLPKPKADHWSKPKKPHTRRSSVTNVEIIASEFDKPIRTLRKVSLDEPVNFIEENPELVLERIKRNLRKVSIPVLQSTTIETETETEKKSTYHNIQKITAQPEKLRVIETETLIIKENEIEGEKINERKKSRRRVSVPMNQEFMENNEPLQIKRSVPSYMAATVSAKAKLRVQDGPETPTTLNRRYSLPSLTNAKVSLSPRLQTTGKLKNDRSLQSSRDGNASVKVNQAEWRR